ncbi:hypothetical protein V6N13_106605 [Hibiscus sabdariffa]|uniref:RNase H type-1 domain-containing protein n=1 Tax=Hibiscus sabdariffa TaxID=183260 RepID=A0ABR2F185_9ROSI
MVVYLIPHSDVNDAFIVEVKTCESTVNFAIELGFMFVHVEGDSPMEITFSHVGRLGNATAHTLAKIHNHFQLPMYWIEEASPEVEQITLSDLR